MLQGQYHGNHVSVTLKVKPVRETVAHFHASKRTVSKRQHCFILHLGDGRQRVWHRHSGSHVELLLAQRGASVCVCVCVVWVGGGVGGLVDIFKMAGRSWYRLTGHRMPQTTTQKSWPVTCCCYVMLWATKKLLASFCWTTIAHPKQCGSINVTRMLSWPTKAPNFKSIECLKSFEAPIEMGYYSHWHKWKHHSLPAGGVASHGSVLALAMSVLCEA